LLFIHQAFVSYTAQSIDKFIPLSVVIAPHPLTICNRNDIDNCIDIFTQYSGEIQTENSPAAAVD